MTTPQKLRIAILCSGYLRSFKTTIVKLKECLLNHLDLFDCDLYLYGVSNEYEADHYVNTRRDFDNLITQLQPKVYMIEHSVMNETVLERIKSMWFKIYVLNQLRKNIEARDNIHYDRVIRIRPDLWLGCGLEEMTDLLSNNKYNKCIIVPECNNRSYPELSLDTLKGYNDQFAIGPSNLMDKYCSVYEVILSAGVKVKSEVVNSSSWLKYCLDQHQVQVSELRINVKLLLKENIIITVAGDSAAGKTTFCHKLKQYITNKTTTPLSVLIFECDRYHKWERGHEEWKSITHLHPQANQIDKMKDDILQLKADFIIKQVDYDHNSGKFTQPNLIEPSSVVLVSGLHSLYDDSLNFLSDLKIYIDADEQCLIQRKIARDTVKRGYTEEQVINNIKGRSKDREEFIKPQQEHADVVIKLLDDSHYEVSQSKLVTHITESELFDWVCNKVGL